MKFLKFIKITILLSMLAILSACSKTAYTVSPSVSSNPGPGSTTIPIQLDILMAVDDTPSMVGAYASIASEAPTFLQSLDESNFDWHFATIPLTTLPTSNPYITQIAASKYDGNHPNWVAAYPGVTQTTVGYHLLAGLFQTADTYSAYITHYLNSTSNEYAFANIQTILQNTATTQTGGFVRPGAALAVIVLGNGNDNSGVNYYPRNPPYDYYMMPCVNDTDNAVCPGHTQSESFANYLSFFQNYKGNAGQFKFYAAVAQEVTTCYGNNATKIGTRYNQMAQATGGAAYDFCTQTIQQVFNDLSSSFTAQKLLYKQQFAVIGFQPEPTSIQITIHRAAGYSESIPQCATGVSVTSATAPSCWTYVGLQSSINTVIVPPSTTATMNPQSGYMIQFSPAAMPIGNDEVEIQATAYGAHNTTS